MTARHLHLINAGPSSTESAKAFPEEARADTMASEESSALERMRAEHDAALEELAFLREQLRSTEVFYAHRLELVYARLRAEHQHLLETIAGLGTEYEWGSRGKSSVQDASRAALSESIDPPTLS